MFYYYLLSDRFNISPESGFLNSGVMVMDLKSLSLDLWYLSILIKNKNKINNFIINSSNNGKIEEKGALYLGEGIT